MAVFMVTSTMKGRMVLKRRWSHITYTCTSSCTLCPRPRPPPHRDVGLVTPELRELQPRHGGEAHNLGTLSVVPRALLLLLLTLKGTSSLTMTWMRPWLVDTFLRVSVLLPVVQLMSFRRPTTLVKSKYKDSCVKQV